MKRALVALFVCFFLALCLSLACQKSVPSSFILKGTLVYDAKTIVPVEGATVCVYKGDDPGFLIEAGPEGMLLNPRGKTDKDGHFEIEVKRSFLPENGLIKLTANPNLYGFKESPITNDKGSLIVLEVSPELEVLDLDRSIGNITLKM